MNYRFGYRASGDASDLQRLCTEYNLQVQIVDTVALSASSPSSGPRTRDKDASTFLQVQQIGSSSLAPVDNESDGSTKVGTLPNAPPRGQDFPNTKGEKTSVIGASPVSSTHVRGALKSGDMDLVGALLSRRHRVVVTGQLTRSTTRSEGPGAQSRNMALEFRVRTKDDSEGAAGLRSSAADGSSNGNGTPAASASDVARRSGDEGADVGHSQHFVEASEGSSSTLRPEDGKGSAEMGDSRTNREAGSESGNRDESSNGSVREIALNPSSSSSSVSSRSTSSRSISSRSNSSGSSPSRSDRSSYSSVGSEDAGSQLDTSSNANFATSQSNSSVQVANRSSSSDSVSSAQSSVFHNENVEVQTPTFSSSSSVQDGLSKLGLGSFRLPQGDAQEKQRISLFCPPATLSNQPPGPGQYREVCVILPFSPDGVRPQTSPQPATRELEKEVFLGFAVVEVLANGGLLIHFEEMNNPVSSQKGYGWAQWEGLNFDIALDF
eukprot:TRINITY_DN7475_c0_g1_i1.p1 TRINITY_DN7475_c0_g1~~TRINITY_DN7475_c0_g1_i1.p1  ORF type:complete len:568 (+),score=93.83 TRINITY_DN7475_c0_g1_i1:223-1704(+)